MNAFDWLRRQGSRAAPLVLLLPLVGIANGESAGTKTLSAPSVDRWTVDAGGGVSSGGAYRVSGTLGQPDADPLQPSSGGAYRVVGGFWAGGAGTAPVAGRIFTDGFE